MPRSIRIKNPQSGAVITEYVVKYTDADGEPQLQKVSMKVGEELEFIPEVAQKLLKNFAFLVDVAEQAEKDKMQKQEETRREHLHKEREVQLQKLSKEELVQLVIEKEMVISTLTENSRRKIWLMKIQQKKNI